MIVRLLSARRLFLATTAMATLTGATPALAQQGPVTGAANAAELEDIVVTAAGFEQKIVDAPASISVISAEQLQQRPYMTLLDAVRDLEGVDVGETRDKTGQGTISLRGMGSDYTLILVNGRRQNNHGDIYPNNFGGNQFNHIPPLDAIERIEVIRGPASTLYGADAMGGVINIITKRALDRWTGSVTVGRTFERDDAYGDDATVDVYANGPVIPGLLNLSVRGSAYDRNASTPVYETVTDPAGRLHVRSLGFGGGGKTVDNENTAYGLSLVFTPTARQTLTLDYDASSQAYDNAIRVNDAGAQEYPVGTVDNINSIFSAGNFCLGAVGSTASACTSAGGTWSRRANPQVGYAASQAFTRDSWSLTHQGDWSFGGSRVSLSHVATNNDGRTMPFTVAERALLLQMIDGLGPYAGLTVAQRRALAEQTFLPRPKRTLESAQYTLDAQMDVAFQLAGEHVAVLGGQVIRGELTDGVFGLESGDPGRTQEHNMWSVFVEDTWQALEPLAITAGLRHDDHEIFGSQLSPRLYGVFSLNDRWTLKGGVSTGFKTPKTTQLYDGIVGFGGQGTSPMFGNPDLKPETSVSTELAVYWEHPAGHDFNVTVFNNTFEDKIASQPCGAGTALACADSGEYADIGYGTSTRATNIDEVVIRGAEVAGRWRISEAVRLRANYTFTDSEQKSGAEIGRPLGNSARHMANASLDWRVNDRLNLLVTGEARSRRYRGLHVITGDELFFRDYAVLNAGGSYALTGWLTLNARVNNVLDEDFTTYDAEFRDLNGDGDFIDTAVGGSGRNEALFFDHYNNKDKGRSLWISVNARF